WRGHAGSGLLLTAHRDRERKRRALPLRALYRDPSTMQLDELAGERQPESGAFHLLVRRPHLAELLEDGLLIRGGDADAGVRDGDLNQAVVHRGSDIDLAALRRELDRVGEEVQQHLLHLALIGSARPDFRGDLLGESDASSTSPLSD